MTFSQYRLYSYCISISPNLDFNSKLWIIRLAERRQTQQSNDSAGPCFITAPRLTSVSLIHHYMMTKIKSKVAVILATSVWRFPNRL